MKRISHYKNGNKHGIEKIYFENNIIKRQCLYYYGFKTKKNL